MGNESIQLVWFKRDLRISDHLPLAMAAQKGKCVCLYVYEPELIEADDFDGAHLKFINDSLAELRFNLRRLGNELLLRKGRMPAVIEELHRQLGISGIWAHEETGNDISFQRDRRVRAWSKSNGIPFQEIPQFGVIRGLKNRDGWAASWKQRMALPRTETPTRLPLPELPSNFETGALQRRSAISGSFISAEATAAWRRTACC